MSRPRTLEVNTLNVSFPELVPRRTPFLATLLNGWQARHRISRLGRSVAAQMSYCFYREVSTDTGYRPRLFCCAIQLVMKSPLLVSFWIFLGYLLLLLIPLSVAAQSTGPERILIHNAILLDPNEAVNDKIVNILISDNKLEVVTEDKISRDQAQTVINVDQGFILGKLELGESPSFIIFHDDPRENFEIMKDTYTYSVLVVEEGVVVRNRLLNVPADDPEDEPKKSGWLAYTPPPFMVPLDYQDASKWNQFETKYISGSFIAMLVMDRMNWLYQDEGSEDQWGDLNFYDGGEIRTFRFGFVGALNFEKPWIYTVFAATQAFDKGFEVQDKNNLKFYDYRLDIPFFKNSAMSIGKQKEPISMDRLTAGIYMINQERAAVSDALLPSRNVGVVWNGNTHLDLVDGTIDGGEMQVATLGLNWWLTPYFSVSAGYKYIWNEKDGVRGESSGLMARLILVLE